jgi:hypothetical protein
VQAPHAAMADDFYATCTKQGGRVEILRADKLKPGATLAQFEQAVALQQKWYKDNGYSDVIELASVAVLNPKTKTASTSPTMFNTIHITGDKAPPATKDAGWTAFVAAYNASSTVVLTQPLCVLSTR